MSKYFIVGCPARLGKETSIYDVHKKIRFLTPLTPVYMGRTPLPLVDANTRSTWNTHRALEMASTMTYQT